MALPPVPPSPMGPGGTAPAAPMQQQRPAQESRQNVLMGLALWFASQAHAAAPMSEHAPDIAGMLSKLGKRFQPPPADIGQAEMKFMQANYAPGAGPAAGPAAKPGMPPTPPPPPMAAPPEMAAAA